MLRAVLDTNVLISAIISDGKARQLFKKGIANKYGIVTSDLILKNLQPFFADPNLKLAKRR